MERKRGIGVANSILFRPPFCSPSFLVYRIRALLIPFTVCYSSKRRSGVGINQCQRFFRIAFCEPVIAVNDKHGVLCLVLSCHAWREISVDWMSGHSVNDVHQIMSFNI